MSDKLKPVYLNDEIDLFVLLETLWKEKFWILVFIGMATISGASYIFLSTPKYLVSTTYTINDDMPLEEASSQALKILSSGWKNDKKQSSFSLKTSYPKTTAYYEKIFHNIAEETTKNFLAQAHSDVEIILHEIPSTQQSTEAISIKMFQAKKIEKAITRGALAIDFGPTSITKISKKSLVFELSIIGGVIGVLFVLIRSAIQNRKKSYRG